MADRLQVEILTPRRVLFSGQALSVRAPGWLGEFGVLPNHDILLSLLRAGVCVVEAEGVSKRFVTGRGFAEVGPDRVTLLVDSAEPAESADKNAATAALAAAEKIMAGSGVDSAEYKLAEEKAELARARLSA